MNLTPTRLQAVAIAASLSVTGAFTAPAVAGTMARGEYYQNAQNIASSPDYDCVAKLFIESASDNTSATGGYSIGTGVVVGGRYLITTAHSVDTATHIEVEVNGKNYRASRWVINRNAYNWDYTDVNRNRLDEEYNPFPSLRLGAERAYEEGHDIAIIELSERIRGARKIKAKLLKNAARATGEVGTIVGYGASGDGEDGVDLTSLVGVKLGGYNMIETAGVSIGNMLVTDFDPAPYKLNSLANIPSSIYNPFTDEYTIDEDDIPISGEYMPATGDSGAGLFTSGKTLAGIASWTSRSDSSYFSKAYYTSIANNYGWISANIKALNGRGEFRGNLELWTMVMVTKPDPDPDAAADATIEVPRYIHVSDYATAGSTSMLGWGDMGTDGDIGYWGYTESPGETFGFDYTDEYATPAALPEPTSLALLSLGGLAMLRRGKH